MPTKFILVDEEFLQEVLKRFDRLESLIMQRKPPIQDTSEEDPMDIADVMEYLKVCRKTVNNYRKQGLPAAKNELGRPRFWKRDIDKFLGKSN